VNWFPVSVEKVIKPGFLTQYKQTLDVFYSDVVRFNTNLFIMDKIASFPFSLFGDGNGDIFFYFHMLNGLETAVLIVHRLLRDNESRAYGLRRFKNEIVKNLMPEHRRQYLDHLERSKIDNTVQELLTKADTIRNNQIAHLSQVAVMRTAKFGRIGLDELHSITDNLNRVFESLCFNTEHIFLPMPYEPNVKHPQGTDSRPDIVRLLDSVAKNSYLLNMPERNPQLWQLHKSQKPGEIEIVNEYRRRNGLMEA
jgi:hypothetical protein